MSETQPRGQTLAEFALVLPILLVVLLAVADFGRVFSASIAVEAVGPERGRDRGHRRASVTKPPDPIAEPAAFNAYYDDLHEQVAKVVCSELSVLPNTTFNAADRTCPSMTAPDGTPIPCDAGGAGMRAGRH